jgi:putative transcriptional regulator
MDRLSFVSSELFPWYIRVDDMNEKDFNDLIASVREARAILRNEKKASRITVVTSPEVTDISQIRIRMGLTQKQFAELFQVSVRTLQGWEQKRRKPDGPAQVLLKLAARAPKMVLEALHS